MISRYLKKKNLENKKEVMKSLKAQRGKYDDTFELWNAKMVELEEKQIARDIAYRQAKKLNPDAKRQPNKTDFFDKF